MGSVASEVGLRTVTHSFYLSAKLFGKNDYLSIDEAVKLRVK